MSACRQCFEETLETSPQRRRTTSTEVSTDDACSTLESCPPTASDQSARSQATKRRRLNSSHQPSSDNVRWLDFDQHRDEAAAHSQSGSELQDSGSSRNILPWQCANDRWSPSGNLDSHQPVCERPSREPQFLVGDSTNRTLTGVPNMLPHGPLPDQPGSLAVEDYVNSIFQVAPGTLPYGPQPDEPGSMAIAGHHLVPTYSPFPCAPQPGESGSLAVADYVNGIFHAAPGTLPYAPQPDEPGSLAVASHASATSRGPHSFPHGPQPSETGSLAIEEYLSWSL